MLSVVHLWGARPAPDATHAVASKLVASALGDHLPVCLPAAAVLVVAPAASVRGGLAAAEVVALVRAG